MLGFKKWREDVNSGKMEPFKVEYLKNKIRVSFSSMGLFVIVKNIIILSSSQTLEEINKNILKETGYEFFEGNKKNRIMEKVINVRTKTINFSLKEDKMSEAEKNAMEKIIEALKPDGSGPKVDSKPNKSVSDAEHREWSCHLDPGLGIL